jgi:phosphoglycolate phosphatase-like HAD superfamily hydrolase
MQAVILSEHALPDADGLFAAAVAHIARKLGRVKPLAAADLPADRAGTVTALDEWAGTDIDWRGELIRYYEDHIPLHLRPSPSLNAALRRLQARGVRIAWWSAGPEEAARIVIHHLGLGRRVEAIGVGGSADVAERLAGELGTTADQAVVVSGSAAELAAAAAHGLGTATPDELVALALGATAATP